MTSCNPFRLIETYPYRNLYKILMFCMHTLHLHPSSSTHPQADSARPHPPQPCLSQPSAADPSGHLSFIHIANYGKHRKRLIAYRNLTYESFSTFCMHAGQSRGSEAASPPVAHPNLVSVSVQGHSCGTRSPGGCSPVQSGRMTSCD